MAKLKEKGTLFAVDLWNGNIKIKVHEGFFKYRIIELNIGNDHKFLSKLAEHLNVPIGIIDGVKRHLGDVDYFGEKHIQDHKVTIIID